MDTKQAVRAIEILSSLAFSDETILSAIDNAINKIRAEALIQCDGSMVEYKGRYYWVANLPHAVKLAKMIIKMNRGAK